MESILREVRGVLNGGFPYIAVAMSLTLPDICAALRSPNGQTNGSKFKAWCIANLGAVMRHLTADDLWSLRCGVIHQGRLGHPQSQFDRVIFVPRNSQRIVIHDSIDRRMVGDATIEVLMLSVDHFCDDILDAVSGWFQGAQNDPNVILNLPRLIQDRPNGLPPQIVGIPVIA